MKQHNILLLGFFVISIHSIATTHAMVRAGAAQAVQSAARSVQSMGALRMTTSAQAVQQVVGRQAAHTFGVRNVMQDALSGVSKNSRRSPEKPKIEASEQEAFGTKQEAFVAKQEIFGAKQKKPDAQQEKIGEKVSQQSSVQDLIQAIAMCSRDAYVGLKGSKKQAEDVGFLAYQRYMYGKSVVCQKYRSNIKPGVDRLRAMDKRPILLLSGAVGVYKMVESNLRSAVSLNSMDLSTRIACYREGSLLMSDKKCLNIIMNGENGIRLLHAILEDELTKDRAWRMVTNNLDIVLTYFFSIFKKESHLTKEVMCKLLGNEDTIKKTAVAALSNSILLMENCGHTVLVRMLVLSEYHDVVKIILDNEKSLVSSSPREQLKVELQKHDVSAVAAELIVGRMPERALQVNS